jgi:hypothetical protein
LISTDQFKDMIELEKLYGKVEMGQDDEINKK